MTAKRKKSSGTKNRPAARRKTPIERIFEECVDRKMTLTERRILHLKSMVKSSN